MIGTDYFFLPESHPVNVKQGRIQNSSHEFKENFQCECYPTLPDLCWEVILIQMSLPLSCSVSVTSHLKKTHDPDPNSDENPSAVSFPTASSMSRIPTYIN